MIKLEKIKMAYLLFFLRSGSLFKTGRTDHAIGKLLLEHECHRHSADREYTIFIAHFEQEFKEERRGHVERQVTNQNGVRQLFIIPIFAEWIIHVIAHLEFECVAVVQLHFNMWRDGISQQLEKNQADFKMRNDG